MRGGPRVPDNVEKEEGGSEWHPKGPGGEGDGGVGWGRRGTGRWQRDGAWGQEGGPSAQTGRGRGWVWGPTRCTRGRGEERRWWQRWRVSERGRREVRGGSEGLTRCTQGRGQ